MKRAEFRMVLPLNRGSWCWEYLRYLKITVPLVLGFGAWSIQHLIDRMFLSLHSAEAIAGAPQAGILNLTL